MNLEPKEHTKIPASAQVRRSQLKDMFEQQVQTLIDFGYADAAGMEVAEFLEYLYPLRSIARKARETIVPHLPFLIVIPERLVSVPKQMALLVIDGKKGKTFLRLGTLRNAYGIVTPNVPYIVLDVEDGSVTTSTAPSRSIYQLAGRGRRGLTAEEGIALATQSSEILKSHSLDLVGSRCDVDDIPGLSLSPASGPTLVWPYAASASPSWGSPSCKLK